MSTPQITRASNERIVALALRKLGQAFCAHNFILQQHRSRLFLRCSECGRETVGFIVRDRLRRRLS